MLNETDLINLGTSAEARSPTSIIPCSRLCLCSLTPSREATGPPGSAGSPLCILNRLLAGAWKPPGPLGPWVWAARPWAAAESTLD